MKKIVSVSLGSSKRDHKVEVELLDEKFEISRIGTDGDFQKAQELLKELDGKVDAIGLGGLDIYLYLNNKRYALRDGLRLMEVVKKTPVVDGSGLKNTLERKVIDTLYKEGILKAEHKVLMVSALDRFGMAESFSKYAKAIIFGDFIFALSIDKPINSLQSLEKEAEKLLPEIVKLPISFIYPTGRSQDKIEYKEEFGKYYKNSDIIAGDFHFIKKFIPPTLNNKIIITNTVTKDDIQLLKEKGVKMLITTTPEMKGRSFGTNVIEAILISLLNIPWDSIKPSQYLEIIEKLNLNYRLEKLN